MKRLILVTFFIVFIYALFAAADDETPAVVAQPVVVERQVLIGESLKLTCPSERPEWWQMNNYAIVETTANGPVMGRPNLAIDGKDLVIASVGFADEGTYSCSDTASPTASFKITVHAIPLPPVVWDVPQKRPSSPDRNLHTVICESRFGRPVGTIKWQVDGQDAEPVSAEIRQEANGTLTLSSSLHVNVSDKVVAVSCQAEHPNYPSGSEFKASRQLRTYSLPTPSTIPARLENLQAGQSIVIECRIPDLNSQSRPSLIWTLPDGVERQQVIIEGGFVINKLRIEVAREWNGKVLSCRSELSYARSIPVELPLAISFAPSKPRIVFSHPLKIGAFGLNDLSMIKVKCEGATANPRALARILVNGIEVSPRKPVFVDDEGKLIQPGDDIGHILSSIRSNGKRTTIACVAFNFIGSNASDIVSMPMYAPPATLQLSSVDRTAEVSRDPINNLYTFRSGSNATFLCDMTGGEMSGDAKNNIIWSILCPAPGSSSPTVETFSGATGLQIDPADPQHARAYYSRLITKNDHKCQLTCKAVDPNGAGDSNKSSPINLGVFYGPESIEVAYAQTAAYKEGESIQAFCEITASNPQPDVAWSILTSNGLETTTSRPQGALSCSQSSSNCNDTIEFTARPEINGAIVRCTATNPKLGVVVAVDKRLDILYKPRMVNPQKCLSRFVVEFNTLHNLSDHCHFEANPRVDAPLTKISLVSATNPTSSKRVLSPPTGYLPQQPGMRPQWEMVKIIQRFNTLEDLNYLDSYLLVYLQNSIGSEEFRIPVRINDNIIDMSFVNTATRTQEVWAGDSVEVTCKINSMYRAALFSFDQSTIRHGDVVKSVSGDLRTITLHIPHIKQDVNLGGDVRRIRCLAQFPADTRVKNITKFEDIKIFAPVEAVTVWKPLNAPEVRCKPTIGQGGKYQYRWWENDIPLNGGALVDVGALPVKPRTRYHCEITQTRGNQVLAVVKSDPFLSDQTPVDKIKYDVNVTALRIFSSKAEFFVSRKPTNDTVLDPNTVLPPSELRVSLHREGNEQEYRLTVSITGDFHLFNISDLVPASAYTFNFWMLNNESWTMVSSVAVTTAGAPVAFLRLRPEETAIIIILSAVTAALFLLFCNIFICIKIRRKRQLMEAARQAAHRRPSSCCFIGNECNDHDATAHSDTSPPASEAESGPTSVVDMLTPNGASCSSSTSNGSANALYVTSNENNSTLNKTDRKSIKSFASSTRRKSQELVGVVQGLFRPDGLLLKPRYAAANPQNAAAVPPPSDNIYRDLFGNHDVNLSPILPNLDFLDGNQAGDEGLYRSSNGVYNIPMPFQFQHVGANLMPATATAITPSRTDTSRAPSSDLPLELQGDLV